MALYLVLTSMLNAPTPLRMKRNEHGAFFLNLLALLVIFLGSCTNCQGMQVLFGQELLLHPEVQAANTLNMKKAMELGNDSVPAFLHEDEDFINNSTKDDADYMERVLGGREAPKGKYTYTSGMRRSRSDASFCGGTLISPRFLVTAAHCVSEGIPWVAIGTHFNAGTSDGEQIQVAKVFVHPRFDRNNLQYDIAILELVRASQFPPARLATKSLVTRIMEEEMSSLKSLRGSTTTKPHEDIPTKIATVHGWGRTAYPGNGSPVLKELNVPLIDNEACAKQLNEFNQVHESMLCAGGTRGQASCHGDSGGPLVINKDSDRPILVGIVSWGVPCGTGKPDVYANVAFLRSFIDEKVTDEKALPVWV